MLNTNTSISYCITTERKITKKLTQFGGVQTSGDISGIGSLGVRYDEKKKIFFQAYCDYKCDLTGVLKTLQCIGEYSEATEGAVLNAGV